MTVLQRFFNALNEEERKLLPVIASDNLGMLLRCAINELDWYYYNLKQPERSSEASQEQLYILQLGVVRLIKLSLDSRSSFDVPVVTSIRRPELSIPTLKIASALGMIQHGRRIAQSVVRGDGKIYQASEKKFEVVLSENLVDKGYYEREVIQHFFKESRRGLSILTATKEWKTIEAEVNSLLDKLVYAWREHFIGYKADPLLDQYFFGLAYHEIMLHEGFDTFHYQVRFGGIQFQSYILALTYILSIFNRHERFAEALIKKAPSVKLENILTISSDTDEFVQSLKDAVNLFGSTFKDAEDIDISQAKKIFGVLSCGRSDTSLIDAPGSPLPYMIRCSEQGFIRCLTGARSEPVRYLLESLRFHHSKEYDIHQQGRELSMQRGVRRVLNDAINGLGYRDNVVLRIDKRALTDIDLVVLESRTGLVILCQIKHQELYGADLHAQRVRGDRLSKQASVWIKTVDEWIKNTQGKRIRDTLQLPKEFPEPIVRKLLISRHYSYPLKDIISREDEYHCNWPNLVNATLIAKKD